MGSCLRGNDRIRGVCRGQNLSHTVFPAQAGTHSGCGTEPAHGTIQPAHGTKIHVNPPARKKCPVHRAQAHPHYKMLQMRCRVSLCALMHNPSKLHVFASHHALRTLTKYTCMAHVPCTITGTLPLKTLLHRRHCLPLCLKHRRICQGSSGYLLKRSW
ncbi:hypothetical protein Lgee_2212 [Legionella geestiana]|uniref:Uncharacterized protein n=1 Tax=Legionella geestiana TaxID=45065 RepID=A0A0W0TLU4_9GAMM|nr:hypothetical protein Lgee_2212 [Legionella geestiana]STX54983.1 Uncharacterised protein [Legionella geestiana]